MGPAKKSKSVRHTLNFRAQMKTEKNFRILFLYLFVGLNILDIKYMKSF